MVVMCILLFSSGTACPARSLLVLTVKYDKNKNHVVFSEFSLEGILHAKQYWCMRSLGVWFISECCMNKQFQIAPNITSHIDPYLVSFGIVQKIIGIKCPGYTIYV